MSTKDQALEYHSAGRPGKIEVISSKPCITQRDLSLAYTPGVAIPCKHIEKNPDDAFKYTAKGNLVAVVSNGTAVLGLGNIGALAGKPVMEGKGVLFKRFADVDVFDLELDTEDPDEIIQVCQLLEPTFGGINLEDIKAPDCFYIEETLKRTMNIPVFHDDQHGTAIISGAGLLNALELVGKNIEDVRVVYNGAGAAGIACASFYVELGVKKENMLLCDSKGVIYAGREDLDPENPRFNKYKAQFAQPTDCRILEDAMKDADVFCGVSVADVVTKDMVRSMAKNPIIFAMANPDPEITYPDAISARDDIIMATGRSDYPNQVNNVLGFPFIFRGALDVRAKAINETMKVAAAQSLAKLAKEDVPDAVCRAYGVETLQFGREYIIPKPFDYRVLLWETMAVAKAACETGVARKPIVDWDRYREELESRLGPLQSFRRKMITKAKGKGKRIVFTEGEYNRVLRAAQQIIDEDIGKPILLGDETVIRQRIQELGLDLGDTQIINPATSDRRRDYAETLVRYRQRKGLIIGDAMKRMARANYYGPMMVIKGDADAIVGGLEQHIPEFLRPALQVINAPMEVKLVIGCHLMLLKKRTFLFADTSVNINPNAEELSLIAETAASAAAALGLESRIAMLSYSNFGSVRNPETKKVEDALEILKKRRPDLTVDGEMQADTACSPEIAGKLFPFSLLKGNATVLIFPNLDSANIGYKLVRELGEATCIGPIIAGTHLPVHCLESHATVETIFNTAAIAAADAGMHPYKVIE